MSRIVPSTGGPGGFDGMPAKVPVPPDAKNWPIPSWPAVAVGHVTPGFGLAGLTGHQSIK